MADVFLAYASEDRERLKPLVEAIRGLGFTVWWDQRIQLGQRFDEVIDQQLKAARSILVVWSDASIKSNYVREEAREGQRRGVLIPVRIDNCEPPYGFRAAQTANLSLWPDEKGEAEWKKVIEGIKSVLDGAPDAVQPNVPVPDETDYTNGETIVAPKPKLDPAPKPKDDDGRIFPWPKVGIAVASVGTVAVVIAAVMQTSLFDGTGAPEVPLKTIQLGSCITQTPVQQRRPEKTDCNDAYCPIMVELDAGSFCMGAPEDEQGREESEAPVHKVKIARPFAIGKHEVTFAQWDACANDESVPADERCKASQSMEEGIAHDEGWGRGELPVINVSWDDAQVFIRWLNKKTGLGYRLPTEAEWEYACRAGATTPYAYGQSISPKLANFNNFRFGQEPREIDNRKQTTKVTSFLPNDFGIHDMHGNVAEWVQDCWTENYNSASLSGEAQSGGNCERRVVRGGAWSSASSKLRCASRMDESKEISYNYFGFRLARTL